MSWVRLDDACFTHPKLLAAGPEAAWFWVSCIGYANRQKARDGFIPDAALGLVYPVRNPRKIADRLVTLRLLERGDGGFVVHDYHEYQPSVDEELRRRRSEAGRIGGQRSGEVRRALAKQVASADEASCFVASEANAKQPDEAPSRPVPTPPVPTEEESSAPDEAPRGDAESRYRQAYADGIANAKGSPFVFPSEKQATWDLNSAIGGFAKRDGRALRGDDLIAWIRSHAEAFARFVNDSNDDPKFWAAFGPKGFGRWLNMGAPRRPREQRRAGGPMKQPMVGDAPWMRLPSERQGD